MKFYGGVLGSTMKNWLNFGDDLGILRWVNEQENTIIVVAYPDRGAGNDPKLFFYLFIYFFLNFIYLFIYFYLFFSFIYLFIYLFFFGGGGEVLVFHHQGSTFLQWAIWE